jgi:hypothetical protein
MKNALAERRSIAARLLNAARRELSWRTTASHASTKRTDHTMRCAVSSIADTLRSPIR